MSDIGKTMYEAFAPDLNQIAGFSPGQLVRFLSVVALELTIAARETYVPVSMDIADPVRLRAVNECQHFILGVLRRALYAEEVDVVSLVETLAALCSDKYMGGALQSASLRAVRQVKAFEMP